MVTQLDMPETTSIAREVTDEEVAFYQENGWVFLKQLIKPDTAAELLKVAEEWEVTPHGRDGLKGHFLATTPTLEPFPSFVFSKEMGRNAQRLINRGRLFEKDVPVRYRYDGFLKKEPGGRGAPYHQDSSEHGSDRIGELQFWVALAECTPEMGTMSFLSGAHKEGPMGAVFGDYKDTQVDILSYYPKLTELYELTPPIHYQAGDATVHHGCTIHGSGENVTDLRRLAYLLSYTPSDTLFWDGMASGNPGSNRIRPDNEIYPLVGG